MTPESQEADLVRQVVEYPDEDHLRLQYADWLQENAGSRECKNCLGRGRYPARKGDRVVPDVWCNSCGGEGAVPDGRADRAEVIQLQVEAARLPERKTITLAGPGGIRTAAFDAAPNARWTAYRSIPPDLPARRHRFACQSTVSSPPVRGEVYDVEATFGGFPGFRLAGAVCERADWVRGDSHSLYDLEFLVTGDRDPNAARRTQITTRLDHLRDANYDLMPGCGVLFPHEYERASAAFLYAPWRRGFATMIYGPWERFRKLADRYLWHPDSGLPCPPTAHPVKTVRLTDLPNRPGAVVRAVEDLPGVGRVTIEGRAFDVQVGDTWAAALGRRWPGVEFVTLWSEPLGAGADGSSGG